MAKWHPPKHTKCECGETKELTKFRSLWYCRECLNRPMVPQNLNEFMARNSPVGCALSDSIGENNGRLP